MTPNTPRSEIIAVLVNLIRDIGIQDELLIVDPYFLAAVKYERPKEYAEFVRSILEPFGFRLSRILLITTGHTNREVRDAFVAMLRTLPKTPRLICRTSEKYHDRCWLNRRTGRGFIVGSSLNSLGRKYAVAQRISEEDGHTVIESLDGSGLLPELEPRVSP